MPVIELRFPTGRLHATPWGRHVNEGAVEWPPSPWRVLRALIATWHLKARDDLPEPLVRELIHALAERAPSFELPRASLGHTRHYMPIIEGRNEKTTKVFDAFIHTDGPLRVHWGVALSGEQPRALALLCARLGYLGRAEAIVEAKVLQERETAFRPNAEPLPENQPMPAGSEIVRQLCAEPAESYARWRAVQMASVPATPVAKKASARRSKRVPAAPALAEDLFAALHADTGELQATGWTLPPGSRLVSYVRPRDCFDVSPRRPRRISGQHPTVARFAVASAVLPRITRAVSVAERVRQALLARFPDGNTPTVFTGRGADGRPLNGHGHARVFCEANGPRDAATHVTLFANDGLDARACRAIESLQRIWGHGGHDLQLVLLGFGDTKSFCDCRLFGASRVWRSLTPFVPTRHAKTHRNGRPKLDADGWQIGSPSHDLRRLAQECGLPAPESVEQLAEIHVNTRRLSPLEFQTLRQHGEGMRGGQQPTAFEIKFKEAVVGPIALGYGAHFGLGLFVPVVERDATPDRDP